MNSKKYILEQIEKNLSENVETISEELSTAPGGGAPKNIFQYFQKASDVTEISNEILKVILKLTNNDFEQARFAMDLSLIKLRVLIELEKFDKKTERDKEREERGKEADERNRKRDIDIHKRDRNIDARHNEKMNTLKNN